MPLHDWTDLPGWEGLHIFWMTEIARALRGSLPAGYRARIWGRLEEANLTLFVVYHERLVSQVEIISPQNKAHVSSRELYADNFLRLLRSGIHLLLIDIHPLPRRFGFGWVIADALRERLPAPDAPSAISYRAAEGGRMLGVWQHALVIGEPLPSVTLPLTPEKAVTVDLEATYARAAADSYVA